MRSLVVGSNIISAVLDAYIIEEIKKREDDCRRHDEESRPRLHIEIPGWPQPGTDREAPNDPRAPPEDDDEADLEHTPSVIHIEL